MNERLRSLAVRIHKELEAIHGETCGFVLLYGRQQTAEIFTTSNIPVEDIKDMLQQAIVAEETKRESVAVSLGEDDAPIRSRNPRKTH